MVYRENVQRYFEPFDHRGPIYLDTYVIFALMAPWSALLPAALVEAHRRPIGDEPRSRSDRFVLAFFWATFVFYTLSGSRRSYYILPILPGAAIMVARLLERPFDRMTALARRMTVLGFGVIALAVVLSPLAFVPPRLFMPAPWAELPDAPARGVLGIFWVGSAAAIVYAVRGFRPDRIGKAIGAIAWLFMFYLFVFAMPAGDAFRSEKPFAAQVRALVADDTAGLALFRNQGPLFYLGLSRPVPQYDRLPDLNAAIDAGKVRWLIVRRRDIAMLKFQAEPAAAEKVYPWDAREHGRNAMILLHLGPPRASQPRLSGASSGDQSRIGITT
jgi:4-amino-4-deoxy-L-arabinose transferase-like glycosyltransferase